MEYVTRNNGVILPTLCYAPPRRLHGLRSVVQLTRLKSAIALLIQLNAMETNEKLVWPAKHQAFPVKIFLSLQSCVDVEDMKTH